MEARKGARSRGLAITEVMLDQALESEDASENLAQLIAQEMALRQLRDRLLLF